MGTAAPKKTRASTSERKSIKLEKSLYQAILKEIKQHPEWGLGSVSEFIRRAIDRELSARKTLVDRRTVEIILNDLSSGEDNRSKDR